MKEKYPGNKEHWFGKNCEWHMCQFDYSDQGHLGTPVLTFCNLQQGGERDWEGNCQMEHCPIMWAKLRITSPNEKCPICGKPLNIYNVAHKEPPEDIKNIRLDSIGRAWCIECTKEHDYIDWDEVYNK